MVATRSAAGRLVARGQLNILQKGRVVDLAGVKGPIRLQLASGEASSIEQSIRNPQAKRGETES
jgi:ribosomal 30S subunit maturation factor RimM